jgi:hypothetical protein
MHEDDPLPRSEHQIRMTRDFLSMQAVAKPQPMDELPHYHFRLGVLIADPPHPLATLL